MPIPSPAPFSTNTSLPALIISLTLEGTSPTLFSCDLISFGTPTNILLPLIDSLIVLLIVELIQTDHLLTHKSRFEK